MSKIHVYVMSQNGMSKIGVTRDPYVRLSQLKAKPEALWQCDAKKGKVLEAYVCAAFADHAELGKEWLSVSSSDLIDKIIESADGLNCKLIAKEWPSKKDSNNHVSYDTRAKVFDWLCQTKMPIRQIALQAEISRGVIYRMQGNFQNVLVAKSHTIKGLLRVSECEQEKVQCLSQ